MRFGVTAALLLPGCVAAQDEIARAAAREAVHEVVATRFPGAPVEPATDCIIDNASAAEIIGVAADSSDGRPGPRTVETVVAVATRPGTIECLGYQALPVLLS